MKDYQDYIIQITNNKNPTHTVGYFRRKVKLCTKQHKQKKSYCNR